LAVVVQMLDELFRFSQMLTGAKAMPPLWKQAIGQVNNCIGEGLGKLYCEKVPHYS
jgi:predicted metalloendopeptidase